MWRSLYIPSRAGATRRQPPVELDVWPVSERARGSRRRRSSSRRARARSPRSTWIRRRGRSRAASVWAKSPSARSAGAPRRGPVARGRRRRGSRRLALRLVQGGVPVFLSVPRALRVVEVPDARIGRGQLGHQLAGSSGTPSPTTSTSRSATVWASALATARRSVGPWSKVGTRTVAAIHATAPVSARSSSIRPTIERALGRAGARRRAAAEVLDKGRSSAAAAARSRSRAARALRRRTVDDAVAAVGVGQQATPCAQTSRTSRRRSGTHRELDRVPGVVAEQADQADAVAALRDRRHRLGQRPEDLQPDREVVRRQHPDRVDVRAGSPSRPWS